MTAGRNMLFAEGPSACPFIALENDRDRRSDEPDHRHRCYAVPTPEPRAMAHQRTYCLTAQFTGCPIFQDWAVRAAARPVPLRPIPRALSAAEPEPDRAAPPPAWAAPPPWERDKAAAASQLSAFDDAPGAEAESPASPREDAPAAKDVVAVPRRAAPAPAPDVERVPSLPLDSPSSEPADGEDDDEAAPPPVPALGGLAASGVRSQPPPLGDAAPPEAERAPVEVPRMEPPSYRGTEQDGLVHRSPLDRQGPADWVPTHESSAYAPPERRQPAIARSSARGRGGRGQPKAEEPTLRREDVVPTWERARYEAYPALSRRSEGGGGRLRRLTTLFAVLAIFSLAAALILIGPGLLGLAGVGPSPTAPVAVATATPTPEGEATPTPSPTPLPHQTWQAYVIQPGDSICRIAARHGITYAQLMGANPRITNPAFIRIGDPIDIPPDDFVPPSPGPDATPYGNPCG